MAPVHPTGAGKAKTKVRIMIFIITWLSKHTLVVFAGLIFLALFFWLMRFQKKLKLGWQEVMLVSFGHVAIGWSSMILLAIIEVGFDLDKAANLRLFGAVFLLPCMYYLWARVTKRNTALVMDVAAICVIFGAISGRFNCFTSGCCNGLPILPGSDICWPLRETELIFYVGFIGFYAGKILKGKTFGQVYGVYMVMYGTIRFLMEFVREEFTTQIGIFHLAHIWSLISVAVGAIMYYQANKKQLNRRSTPKLKPERLK